MKSPLALCVPCAALLLALSVGPSAALAQPWVSYDAWLGSLPQDQCWTKMEQIGPGQAPYVLDLVEGTMHLSTLPFGSNSPLDNGGGVWFQRSDVSIDFATDFAVEARVRIASSPDHSINTQSGWPRPGFSLVVFDIHGRIFWIGLGNSEIFLSNTSFGQYGAPNTITTTFNTTDQFHTYRIERAPGGVGAALRIDGVLMLTLATLGPVENTGGLIYFGDGTFWANSESFTQWVRYSGEGNGPITSITGPEPALACPASPAMFSVTASGPGPFTYQWQIQTSPGVWSTLGNDPFPFACPGGVGSGHAFASQPGSSQTPIGVHACPGVDEYLVRCIVTNACGSLASSPATLSILPDINGDGAVNTLDLTQLLSQFGQNLAPGTGADLNADGTVNTVDLIRLLGKFGKTC